MAKAHLGTVVSDTNERPLAGRENSLINRGIEMIGSAKKLTHGGFGIEFDCAFPFDCGLTFIF
jgi:hypothetical protein